MSAFPFLSTKKRAKTTIPPSFQTMSSNKRTKGKAKGKRDEESRPEGSVIPQDLDVILGRGLLWSAHEGNRRFYEFLDSVIQAYKAATTKTAKGRIVKQVYHQVTQQGRFVRKDTKTDAFFVISALEARTKIGHAIRFRTRKLDEARRLAEMRARGGDSSSSQPIADSSTSFEENSGSASGANGSGSNDASNDSDDSQGSMAQVAQLLAQEDPSQGGLLQMGKQDETVATLPQQQMQAQAFPVAQAQIHTALLQSQHLQPQQMQQLSPQQIQQLTPQQLQILAPLFAARSQEQQAQYGQSTSLQIPAWYLAQLQAQVAYFSQAHQQLLMLQRQQQQQQSQQQQPQEESQQQQPLYAPLDHAANQAQQQSWQQQDQPLEYYPTEDRASSDSQSQMQEQQQGEPHIGDSLPQQLFPQEEPTGLVFPSSDPESPPSSSDAQDSEEDRKSPAGRSSIKPESTASSSDAHDSEEDRKASAVERQQPQSSGNEDSTQSAPSGSQGNVSGRSTGTDSRSRGTDWRSQGNDSSKQTSLFSEEDLDSVLGSGGTTSGREAQPSELEDSEES